MDRFAAVKMASLNSTAAAGTAKTAPPIDDAYWRCYRALHLVTHTSIPCVDESLKVWHDTQKLTIAQCTAIGKCPIWKKPNNASCQNCVAWAKAVENAAYQTPQTTQAAQASPKVQTSAQTALIWSNVNASQFWSSHVEVAKAYVLRLPKKQKLQSTVGSATTATVGSVASASAISSTASTTSSSSSTGQLQQQVYTQMSDFDSASLLMIMARFSLFHKGSQKHIDVISKVRYYQ